MTSSTYTIGAIEHCLSTAGFDGKIPINRDLLAGGDGNYVENCPIGYYRFHFWKNDEEWKDHENWISNTDMGGPICISLIYEEHATINKHLYRLAYKSVILCEEDIATHLNISNKGLGRIHILAIALREFLAHEMENICSLESEFGAMSIHSTCSINPSSNELVRSLPSSRLRWSNSGFESHDKTFSPSGSNHIVNGNPISQNPETRPTSRILSPDSAYASLAKNFRELCKMNPMELAKTFTLVKGRGLYRVLLSLEKSLLSQVANFDVITTNGFSNTFSWDRFSELLGTQLSKGSYINQTRHLSCRGITSELLHDIRTSYSRSDFPSPLKETKFTDYKTRRNMSIEFVVNEAKYIRKLASINKNFIDSSHPSMPLESSPSEIIKKTLIISPEEYETIFEGIPILLQIHLSIVKNLVDISNIEELSGEKLAKMVSNEFDTGSFTTKMIAETLLRNLKNLEFYGHLLSTVQQREKILKALLDGSPEFRLYAETVANDAPERTLIDHDLGSLFQHVMRYTLQLAKIIESTPEGDDDLSFLLQCYYEVDIILKAMEEIKKNNDSLTDSFKFQYRIMGCPPAIVNPRRAFIMKMAAYSVRKGEVDFSTRYTFYLFEDVLMGAKRLKNKAGKLSINKNKSSIVSKTHEFVFAAPVAESELKTLDVAVKVKNNFSKAFSIELAMEFDENLLNRRSPLVSNFLLVPKKMRKFLVFREKFLQARQKLCIMDSNSTTQIRTLSCPGENIKFYFYIYRLEEYHNIQSRSQIAIVFFEETPLSCLESLLNNTEIKILLVVQAIAGGYRLIVKARETIVSATDCFEPSREFQSPFHLQRNFLKALQNSFILQSIYPPFMPEVQIQLREQLLRHIEPFSRGIYRKFKEFTNKLKSTKEIAVIGKTVDDDVDPYAIDDVPTTDIGNSQADYTQSTKKKDMLSRFLSKLKSPLGD